LSRCELCKVLCSLFQSFNALCSNNSKITRDFQMKFWYDQILAIGVLPSRFFIQSGFFVIFFGSRHRALIFGMTKAVMWEKMAACPTF
jgi:hypothetical protein